VEYYFNCLAIIEEVNDRISGKEIQRIFIKKYRGGSVQNINKALKQLRKNKNISFQKEGINVFYEIKKKN